MITIPGNEYQIEIGSLTESGFQNLLNTRYLGSKKIILVDENTHDFCLEYLLTSFDELKEAEIMLLPCGEENKVLEVCFQVWDAMSEYEISRKDLVINLGGGVVTDMGGFIASVFKRGVDFIHIPTTLLGMVDAAIGGKTGIDLGSFKNQIGTFQTPVALYLDLGFLQTLPAQEVLNGYAEMLKHALIADPSYWKELTSISSMSDLINENLIKRSVEIKNTIVINDPKESGERKKLNFGHTIGHGIEGFLLHQDKISHGHAVGLGMLAESFISYQRTLLNETDWLELLSVLSTIFPMIDLKEEDFDAIIQLMRNDKKNNEGKIKSCLLNQIGVCSVDQEIGITEIKEALRFLVSLS
jgi:3-dehydroquinate synthase